MKKQKYVSINHNWFTLKTGSTAPNDNNRSLFDCYDRPSNKKIEIWFGWKEELENTFENVKTWVHSYNKNVFTIGFTGYYQGVNYTGIIYPTHHEIWEVK